MSALTDTTLAVAGLAVNVAGLAIAILTFWDARRRERHAADRESAPNSNFTGYAREPAASVPVPPPVVPIGPSPHPATAWGQPPTVAVLVNWTGLRVFAYGFILFAPLQVMVTVLGLSSTQLLIVSFASFIISIGFYLRFRLVPPTRIATLSALFCGAIPVCMIGNFFVPPEPAPLMDLFFRAAVIILIGVGLLAWDSQRG